MLLSASQTGQSKNVRINLSSLVLPGTEESGEDGERDIKCKTPCDDQWCVRSGKTCGVWLWMFSIPTARAVTDEPGCQPRNEQIGALASEETNGVGWSGATLLRAPMKWAPTEE